MDMELDKVKKVTHPAEGARNLKRKFRYSVGMSLLTFFEPNNA